MDSWGISGTGIEGARRNLREEIPDWDFDQVRQNAEAEWSRLRGRLDATLPDIRSARVSNSLTRSGLPWIDDARHVQYVDGNYRGLDKRNHGDPGFTKYTTISRWDTCRSEIPPLTLVQPERINNLVQTLLADYAQLQQQSLTSSHLPEDRCAGQTGRRGDSVG